MHTGATQVGRCMCLCPFMCAYIFLCVFLSVSVYKIDCIGSIVDYAAGSLCSQFLFTCCKVGVNRVCATRGNAEVGSTMKYETMEAGCQEEHTKNSLKKRKESSNVTRKVFSVQGLHVFAVPSE